MGLGFRQADSAALAADQDATNMESLSGPVPKCHLSMSHISELHCSPNGYLLHLLLPAVQVQVTQR